MSSRADTTLPCASCGVRFLYTRQEQRARALVESAQGEPQLCPGCQALQALTATSRGTVEWYNAHKGYGFVRDDDGREVFVHRSTLRPSRRLRSGQRVEYELEQTEKGLMARNVFVVT